MDDPNCSSAVSADDAARSMPSSTTVKAHEVTLLIWSSKRCGLPEQGCSDASTSIHLCEGSFGGLSYLKLDAKFFFRFEDVVVDAQISALRLFGGQ